MNKIDCSQLDLLMHTFKLFNSPRNKKCVTCDPPNQRLRQLKLKCHQEQNDLRSSKTPEFHRFEVCTTFISGQIHGLKLRKNSSEEISRFSILIGKINLADKIDFERQAADSRLLPYFSRVSQAKIRQFFRLLHTAYIFAKRITVQFSLCSSNLRLNGRGIFNDFYYG